MIERLRELAKDAPADPAIERTLHGLLDVEANGAWRVVDVETDGVSLTRSYREQFQDLLEREATFDASWEAMLERLGDNVGQETPSCP